MCRMYASIGGRGPQLDELLAFRGLCGTGCGGPHGDGWGLVGYGSPGRPETLHKSTLAAATDEAFEPAARRAARFPVLVGHLRKASSGVKALDNTHPFTRGAWTFAHNGTIRDQYVEKMAPEPGMNDSRTLFARIYDGLASDPVEALRAGVREVKELGFSYSSITVLVTDGERLYAARDVRERPHEYAMLWQVRSGRTVMCQEPIGPGDWHEVPNGHVAVARAGSVELVKI